MSIFEKKPYIPTYFSDEFDTNRRVIPQDYNDDCYYTFFSKRNILNISYEITRRLQGVHPDGKNIIVSDDNILSVMDSIYNNTYKDVQKMTMMTIAYIVDYITTEFKTIEQNNKLNIWVTQYTDDWGIKQVSKIKIREKRPTPMIFNMNY
jgi:hypothetical protein